MAIEQWGWINNLMALVMGWWCAYTYIYMSWAIFWMNTPVLSHVAAPWARRFDPLNQGCFFWGTFKGMTWLKAPMLQVFGPWFRALYGEWILWRWSHVHFMKNWLVVWNFFYLSIYWEYLGIIIPTDELIFFREIETTNQTLNEERLWCVTLKWPLLDFGGQQATARPDCVLVGAVRAVVLEKLRPRRSVTVDFTWMAMWSYTCLWTPSVDPIADRIVLGIDCGLDFVFAMYLGFCMNIWLVVWNMFSHNNMG